MPTPRPPTIVPPRSGRVATLPGEVVVVAMSSRATGGGVLVLDYRVEPGAGPPLHRHAREDETFLVLEGEVAFHIDGVRHAAPAGTTLHAPRGSTHTFRNLSSASARMIVIITPGDTFEAFYDAFVAMMAAPGTMEQKGPAIAALGATYGVEILGPSPL